jgi:tetratricopeptide (TPR) repeat protein
MTTVIREHADRIDYDPFRVPGLLLEAWAAEHRGDRAAAVGKYRDTVELGRRIAFADHAAFALSGLGSDAFTRGDLAEAERLHREALATAEAAHANWAAEHARAELARTLAAAGRVEDAAELFRQVLAWSQTRRTHRTRESLVRGLADDPATVAELGLAELGETALT